MSFTDYFFKLGYITEMQKKAYSTEEAMGDAYATIVDSDSQNTAYTMLDGIRDFAENSMVNPPTLPALDVSSLAYGDYLSAFDQNTAYSIGDNIASVKDLLN